MIDSPALRLKRQEEVDFQILYEDHGPGVYRLASRLCGPRLAADVTQDVFLRYWKNPDRFDPERGSLHSLLLTMAHHMSIDLIRSETRRRAREVEAGISASAYIEPDTGPIEDERSAKIAAALSRLPVSCREAIEVAFYGECTYQEASIVLNIPEGTAKARIRRGMTLLRSELVGEKSFT